MLRKEIHRQYMFNILMEIFSSDIGSSLAFKWGTLCYFVYGLDRFSTDLDFDVIWNVEISDLQETLTSILLRHGVIKESYNKANTLFFLLSYGETDMNIKIECNKRIWKANTYSQLNFYGVNINAMDKTSIFANKLVALTDRKTIANRDIYDIHFFLKQAFEINEEIILERTGKSLKEYLREVRNFLDEGILSHNLLDGLWEVLDEKQKAFVKQKLLLELKGMLDMKIQFLR